MELKERGDEGGDCGGRLVAGVWGMKRRRRQGGGIGGMGRGERGRRRGGG